ncbi:DUF4181 domain-containing protein [Rossellomorea vietnamensis]|uniref:DUF4181 domain-containing protein n=1 Tax=Rossellomorea vietnamensis TaxID=218284 RepID=A0A0P6W5W1_9BACI|nr:hypothetical protein AM506_06740 [Rossellomorea vietnamensis]
MLGFILKFFFIIAIYIILIFLFHRVISRYLGLEKRKFFSHEMVNEQHEKGDKLIGYFAVVTLIAGFIFHVTTNFDVEFWFLQPYFIIAFFFIARQLWKSYMERKWMGSTKEYLYTLMEAVLYILLFSALFSSNSWLI